jgi:hypothetical protein
MSDKKKKSNNDLIAQALDITPLTVVPAETPIVVEQRDHPLTRLNDDLETARNNILKAITTGVDSLELLKQIAVSTEHPRAFEVLSTLINTVINANKELIDVHRQARDISDAEVPEGPEQVTNNLFVGTTEEALAMLRAKRLNGENKQE